MCATVGAMVGTIVSTMVGAMVGAMFGAAVFATVGRFPSEVESKIILFRAHPLQGALVKLN